MAWYYLDPVDINNFNVFGYSETPKTSFPIVIEDNRIRISMVNSNLGTTSCIYNTVTPVGEWIFICVTGSVLNGVCKIFLNGELKQSATMTYSNYSYSDAKINDTQESDIAQLNIYNRELTEAEVAEHYVYDDDTMTSGVLGFDAMNPAQKSGLIYSSSFIEDVSIAGGEFNDKSGNNITLSPQPSLTGEQIYVYTDASDLPSDTAIYPVNSADFNGTSNFMALTDSTYLAPLTGSVTVSTWVYADRTSYPMLYTYTNGSGSRANINIHTSNKLEVYFASGVGQERSYMFDYVIPDGWSHIVYNWTRTTDTDVGELYVNGTRVSDAGVWVAQDVSWTGNSISGKTFEISRLNINGGLIYYSQKMSFSAYTIGNPLTQADVTYLYNSGVHDCWDDIATNNPTLYAKIEECFDLGTYNGSTELQARTGHKNGWVLDNTSATPFTGTGLSVECGGSPVETNKLGAELGAKL
jgi:hypothetical protein